MIQSAERKTILVVDDDAHLLSSLVKRLSRQGFDVITASRGEEAVAQARNSSPNAITLDVRLPDLDGLEVAEKLLAEPATAEIPIVFLTGKVDAHVKDMCRQMKSGYFIRKPFDPILLAHLLKSILAQAEQSEVSQTPQCNCCTTMAIDACH